MAGWRGWKEDLKWKLWISNNSCKVVGAISSEAFLDVSACARYPFFYSNSTSCFLLFPPLIFLPSSSIHVSITFSIFSPLVQSPSVHTFLVHSLIFPPPFLSFRSIFPLFSYFVYPNFCPTFALFSSPHRPSLVGCVAQR